MGWWYSGIIVDLRPEDGIWGLFPKGSSHFLEIHTEIFMKVKRINRQVLMQRDICIGTQGASTRKPLRKKPTPAPKDVESPWDFQPRTEFEKEDLGLSSATYWWGSTASEHRGLDVPIHRMKWKWYLKRDVISSKKCVIQSYRRNSTYCDFWFECFLKCGPHLIWLKRSKISYG